MTGVVIRELKKFHDERGWLVEIFRTDEIDFRPLMSYISMTKPGVVRGPHEHREQSDYFYFVGNFRLYLWDNRRDSGTYKEKMIIEKEGTPFIAVIPPGVVHAYRNIGIENGYVINLPDRLYRGDGKTSAVDEIRYESDPESPFRIE